MAVDVVMPQMGESIAEGTVSKWLKKAGDKIEAIIDWSCDSCWRVAVARPVLMRS